MVLSLCLPVLSQRISHIVRSKVSEGSGFLGLLERKIRKTERKKEEKCARSSLLAFLSSIMTITPEGEYGLFGILNFLILIFDFHLLRWFIVLSWRLLRLRSAM